MAVQGKYLYWNSDLSEVYHIRNEVLYSELQVHNKYEEIEKDRLSTIAIVYSHEDDKKAVGTGRIIYDGENYIIDQVLVLKEERKKYYGDFITRLLTTKAFMSGAKEVLLITNYESLDFFYKLGFVLRESNIRENDEKWCNMYIKQDYLCKKCNI